MSFATARCGLVSYSIDGETENRRVWGTEGRAAESTASVFEVVRCRVGFSPIDDGS